MSDDPSSYPPGASCPWEEKFPDLIPHEWTQRPWYVRLPLALFGLVLIVLGMLGWLMPVIPGFFLVPVGVVLIASTSRLFATRINALDRRLPRRVRRILHAPLRRHRPVRPTAKREIAKQVE